MAYVVIDFETDGIKARPYYPPKPCGVAILHEGKPPVYYAWGHPAGNNCSLGQVQQVLEDIWRSGAEMIFHNAAFDLEVALEHFGLPLPPWHKVHDTLYMLFLDDPYASSYSLKPSAQRLLGEPPTERDAVRDWLVANKLVTRTQRDWGAYISKAPASVVGPYAIGDVTRTLGLFNLLRERTAGQAYDRERQLMPILLRNEREGLRVDTGRLWTTGAALWQGKLRAERWLQQRLNAPGLDFNKDTAVADALDRAGLVKQWHLTPTGKRSTAGKAMKVEDAQVAHALGYVSRAQTCLATFLEPWFIVARDTGLIFTNWNQVRGERGGARTGRLSSTPNFQNIPKDFSDKNDGYEHPSFIDVVSLPLVRELILPDDDDSVIVHRDYNQQELRILAHFENNDLFDAFTENPHIDVHGWVKGRMEEIVKREVKRRPVKILNFSIIYGGGKAKVQELIGCTMDEAETLMRAHRYAMPGIDLLKQSIKDVLSEGLPIMTWGGRNYYCEPPIEKAGRVYTFKYKLLNYLIQGSAADCNKQAMINYDAIKRDGRLMSSVHDELNLSVPKKAAAVESELLRQAMEGVDFTVPMLTTYKQGPNWGSLVEIK